MNPHSTAFYMAALILVMLRFTVSGFLPRVNSLDLHLSISKGLIDVSGKSKRWLKWVLINCRHSFPVFLFANAQGLYSFSK